MVPEAPTQGLSLSNALDGGAQNFRAGWNDGAGPRFLQCTTAAPSERKTNSTRIPRITVTFGRASGSSF
jgi:hypothetical protein